MNIQHIQHQLQAHWKPISPIQSGTGPNAKFKCWNKHNALLHKQYSSFSMTLVITVFIQTGPKAFTRKHFIILVSVLWVTGYSGIIVTCLIKSNQFTMGSLCVCQHKYIATTAVPVRRNGNFQTPISVPAVRPKRCHTLSNPAHRQDYTVACLINYTLQTMMPLPHWPVMAPKS